MLGLRIVDAIARQDWVDQASRGLNQLVSQAFEAGGSAGQRIENALHGTGTGHPLHPALTDVPVGAWTTAFVLDALDMASGDERYAPGADAAIALGLVGAVSAALTGIADWRHLHGKRQRVGFLHATLNIAATVLYTGSYMSRRRGARDTGRGLAFVGYSMAGLGAYLGGDLVYNEKVGPTHAEPVETELDYTPVMREADLPENEPQRVEVGDRAILVVRQRGQVYAIAETCSHLGGPLADGELQEGAVVCPWHGSRFALEDGRPLDGPAAVPQPCFETRVRDGQLEVRAKQAG